MSSIAEIRQRVLDEFVQLKIINAELLTSLTDYSTTNNCENTVLMQGLTFKQGIELLEKVRRDALTPENFEGIKGADSMENLEDLSNSLNIQIRAHKEVKNLFDYFISIN